MSDQAQVQCFLDKQTETWTNVVYDEVGGRAAIIDPVLDFDYASGHTSTENADAVIYFVREQKLSVDWILETHAHADHLSAAPYMREQLGGKIATGERITHVQKNFKGVFNLEDEFKVDGSQFDYLFADGETFQIGKLQAATLATPGHTPSDVSWVIGDKVFIGDTLFMPDIGTARCDFPGGDATTLYRSAKKLLAMPDDTQLYTGHDYPADNREYQCMATVAEHRQKNIHLRDGISEEEYVAMRNKRDAT